MLFERHSQSLRFTVFVLLLKTYINLTVLNYDGAEEISANWRICDVLLMSTPYLKIKAPRDLSQQLARAGGASLVGHGLRKWWGERSRSSLTSITIST